MFGWTAYFLGYDAGQSDHQRTEHQREVVHGILYGRSRSVTVDQSYIDQLHAALEDERNTGARLYAEGFDWKQKAYQLRDEALYWRDQKLAPVKATAKALRKENAVLLARLEERDPDIAAEQAAHDKTFEERQSLHRFRVVATSLIDALLAGRADRPEFAELLGLAKEAADTIERGDLFTAFHDEPEKENRLCDLADALLKP